MFMDCKQLKIYEKNFHFINLTILKKQKIRLAHFGQSFNSFNHIWVGGKQFH